MRDSVTILVLEPHPVALDTVSSILEMKGYRVLRADGGASAIAICRDKALPIDLLVTDTALTDSGGAAALHKQLQELRPELAALFFSGYERDILIARGWLDPGAPFLQKPFTARGLLDEVQRLLSGSQRRAAKAE